NVAALCASLCHRGDDVLLPADTRQTHFPLGGHAHARALYLVPRQDGGRDVTRRLLSELAVRVSPRASTPSQCLAELRALRLHGCSPGRRQTRAPRAADRES